MNLKKKIEIINKNNNVHSFDRYSHINYEKFVFLYETFEAYAYLDTDTNEVYVEWLDYEYNIKDNYSYHSDYDYEYIDWEQIEYSKYDKNLINKLRFTKGKNEHFFTNRKCCQKSEIKLNNDYIHDKPYDITYYIFDNHISESTVIGETDNYLLIGYFEDDKLVDVKTQEKTLYDYKINYTKDNFKILDEL